MLANLEFDRKINGKELQSLNIDVRRRTWRMSDGHTSDKDQRFLDIKKKVLERDDHTCQFCGFRSAYDKNHGSCMEVHHIDDDHANNGLKNLLTACTFCHMTKHIGYAGMLDRATMIYLPEIPQAYISHISRAILLAIIDGSSLSGPAQALQSTLESRALYIEEVFGVGASDPTLYGQAILDSEPEDINQKTISGIRILPFPSSFIDYGTYLQKHSFSKIKVSDWENIGDKVDYESLLRNIYGKKTVKKSEDEDEFFSAEDQDSDNNDSNSDFPANTEVNEETEINDAVSNETNLIEKIKLDQQNNSNQDDIQKIDLNDDYDLASTLDQNVDSDNASNVENVSNTVEPETESNTANQLNISVNQQINESELEELSKIRDKYHEQMNAEDNNQNVNQEFTSSEHEGLLDNSSQNEISDSSDISIQDSESNTSNQDSVFSSADYPSEDSQVNHSQHHETENIVREETVSELNLSENFNNDADGLTHSVLNVDLNTDISADASTDNNEGVDDDFTVLPVNNIGKDDEFSQQDLTEKYSQDHSTEADESSTLNYEPIEHFDIETIPQSRSDEDNQIENINQDQVANNEINTAGIIQDSESIYDIDITKDLSVFDLNQASDEADSDDDDDDESNVGERL